jgi:DNA excision repair protein ERCC-2
VYLDVVTQTEHPVTQACSARAAGFFEQPVRALPGLGAARGTHRAQRDAALEALAFPQMPFRPGQRDMAAGVYRACVQSRPLLVQAPTGIGKTLGTVFPALKAMPAARHRQAVLSDRQNPGRQIALDALGKVRGHANRLAVARAGAGGQRQIL